MSLSFYVPNTAQNVTFDGPYAELEQTILSASTGKYLTVSSGNLLWSTPNTANSVAVCDGSGFIPSSILPSYVDDVLTFANLAAFPATGETGKIYVALDTSYSYRWTGSAYFNISTHQFYSKSEVDALLNGKLNLAGGTMLSATVTGFWIIGAAGINCGSYNSPNGTQKISCPDTGNVGITTDLNMNNKTIGAVSQITGTNAAAVCNFGTIIAQSQMQTPTIQIGNVGAYNGSNNTSGSFSCLHNADSYIVHNSSQGTLLRDNIMLQLDSTNLRFQNIPSSTGTALVIDGFGIVYRNTSSMRYKKNIRTYDIDTSEIYDYQPMKYEYKHTNATAYGYIAEQMVNISPHLITYDSSNQIDGINYQNIIIMLVEEVKKLRQRIEIIENN